MTLLVENEMRGLVFQMRFVPASHLEAVEAERDAAHHALRQCIRLTGVDLSDGFPTQPPLHEFAVDEVYRMREEADECPTPEDLADALARASRAEEALREMSHVKFASTEEMQEFALAALHPSQPKEPSE